MIKYDLSDMEDFHLHDVVMYRNGRTLYEYFVEMPLEDLQAYPQKGWRWWMGRKARSPEAMELRDYVLHWRLAALEFRQKYSHKYLQTLSCDEMRLFLNTYIRKTPIWVYSEPIKDGLHILLKREKASDRDNTIRQIPVCRIDYGRAGGCSRRQNRTF